MARAGIMDNRRTGFVRALANKDEGALAIWRLGAKEYARILDSRTRDRDDIALSMWREKR
jgi:hypothetical protein